MEDVLFDGWSGPLRVVMIGALAYAVLILFLRISGKRTLAKLNAFDLVVTVALGSTLATILLNNDVSLVEGAAAFGMLIGLQFVVTWCTIRWGWLRNVVTGEPALLVHKGRLLDRALRRERVTRTEIHAVVRAAGLPDVAEAEAVVLETDGSFSVVKRRGGSGDASLTVVPGHEAAASPAASQ